jgi:hypothetical protein
VTRGDVASFVDEPRAKDDHGWFNTSAAIAPGNSGGLAADQAGRIVGLPTLSRSDPVDKSARISRIRSVQLAQPLIEAAKAGQPYRSPYVTASGPTAKLEFHSFARAGDPEVDFQCQGRVVRGDALPAGLASLAVAFDYEGMPANHADALFLVRAADGTLIGATATADSYPTNWAEHGCVVISIGLRQRLAKGDAKLEVYLGPNYDHYADLKLHVTD